jgi:PAS domain S-box-containing protein
MDSSRASADDSQALRRCVRELAALSTLSAVWSGGDLPQIAAGLSSVLCRSLPVEFVYVRLNNAGLFNGTAGTEAVEAGSSPEGALPAERVEILSRSLEPLVTSATLSATMPSPFGGRALQLFATPLGFGGDCGVVIAGSPQRDFPSDTDRLMLSVAANQAAIVLLQQRSEARTRRSEQELADFFENATVGLHSAGPDGTILRANRAELSMLGYSADEYIGHHVTEFHADGWIIEDILRRLRGGENVRNCEARMRCRDGSIKHVRIDASALWEDGRFIHTRSSTRDITEQKRAEETRLRLAALVESSEDAIIGKDLNGTITSWNRGAEALYGYTAEEVVGKTVSMLIPPDHQDDFPIIMERLRRGERIEQYETVRLCKDGRRVDVALTVSPIRAPDGKIQGASKIARDITSRKRAEETLRKQSDRLRLLWEAAAVLLSADDPDVMLRTLFGKIGPHLGVDAYFNHVVNESGDALRLSSSAGVSDESLRLLTHLELGDGLIGSAALHRRSFRASHIQQSDDANMQALKLLGLRACACNPLLAGDRLLGTLSFATRVKDAFDDDEVAFIETVCHYVTVACERLRLLNELRESSMRKDEFLAMLAHELRNPLAPIRTAVQVLHVKGSPMPDARWSRAVIDRQLQHLTRLVDDLLDISRITRNKLVLQRSPIELAEVITAAVESSRPLIEQSGHELTVALTSEPVYIDGDPVRLSQVFQNLLNNAAKYTERGGRISLIAERQDDSVVVRVKDTGVGIPPDTLPRLFEMFYQADRSLERAQSGLGVGLTLVRRLVDAHGGRVEARSEGVGKGSEFIVRLPMLSEPPTLVALPQAGNAERNVISGLRILVADDNRDSADLFAMFFEMMGNEVQTAYDGIAAVEEAERFRPDAVLLDIGMPRLNGEDACRRIRSTPWGRDAVLIAVTGWNDEDNRRRIVEAGFDAHLVKPVDPSSVAQLLASRVRAPQGARTAERCGPGQST